MPPPPFDYPHVSMDLDDGLSLYYIKLTSIDEKMIIHF